jgi:ABC-type sugar transport system ATPase subunit
MTGDVLLEMRGIDRHFPGVHAVRGVDFELRAGEVHALVGENGAGKSTLIKILSGAVVPDTGAVVLEGRPLPLGDPLAVGRRGLSVVYQEFTLVPELTVAENVFLGRERAGIFLHRAEMNRMAQEILDGLGVRIAATSRVGSLSIAHQQMVEIARALVSDAKVLVLDEPSATLPGTEVERLFAVLRRLRDRGFGVVYISHRLEEIFAIADRVTVLRDGRKVASAPAAGLDRAGLIRWMVGREVSEEFPERPGISEAARHGEPVLEVRGLSAPRRFSDVSFTARAGEIVGLAGLVGAGRTSTGLALVGALASRGDMRLNGRPVHFKSPADAIEHGVAYVTEDRKTRGLFPEMGVDANITVTYLSMFARGGVLSLSRERSAASAAARDYDVRSATLTQPIATLSGGNQQKVLLARHMLKRPAVVILDEPTRGVDVGARAEIYRIMNRLTAEGVAIIMMSSDLPEVLGMSDRVVVMREGRTTGELARADATAERVMALAMAG